MTVVSVKELVNRDGSLKGTRETITRAWQIKVSSPYDNSHTIGSELVGSSLPGQFESHPNNVFATARSLSIKNAQGLIWTARCEYSTEPLTQDERERAEEPNPTNRSVKVSWSTSNYDKPVVKDVDDKGVVNSAGDFYDPPPSVPWERLSFHFRKNYSSPSPWISAYCNSVNDSDISILGIAIPKGMARFCQPSGSEEREENGQVYHETTWDIEVDVRTWQLEVLDEGLRQVDSADTTKRINITDDDGNEITAPALLDGSGYKLDNPDLDNAVFNEHKVYYEKDYTQLPGVSAGTGG